MIRQHKLNLNMDEMRIWVDTDFGFDDLWALLVLKHFRTIVDGVSLVAGNTPLTQVISNAEASAKTFNLDWPMYAGADKPLQRDPETAECVLGRFGMQSRGLYLPYGTSHNSIQSKPAIDAMVTWLDNNDSHHIIALGPLTNLAQLITQQPELIKKITQITWLGGSIGRGNHSTFAEYNALADPEALSVVVRSNVPLKIVELELCRQVSFSEADMPIMQGPNQQLVADLLGGYLDIAIKRGRSVMSIYDPLAALAAIDNRLFEFVSAKLTVDTQQGAQYGRTVVDTSSKINTSKFEIALKVDVVKARQQCLAALVNV